MEQKEKIFPRGIIFKKPKEGVPEWIKGHLSFKVDEACIFLQENAQNGWVNIDIKKSKEKGTLYLELNTYKPTVEKRDSVEVTANDFVEGIPF